MKKVVSLVLSLFLFLSTFGTASAEVVWYGYILSCGRVIYDELDEEMDEDYFADTLEEYEIIFCQVPNSQGNNP